MSEEKTNYIEIVTRGIWKENPVAYQVLGICSALAVTVKMSTAVVMGIALTIVTAFASLIISSLRKKIPSNIRIIVELAIISSLVIVTDQILKAFFYDISKQLSIFVGLIITNCIVLGRAEAFALANKPLDSFFDGIGNGLGYSLVLVSVAFLRELLGSGKFLGFNIIPQFIFDAGYQNMGLMVLAPGAFFIIGLLVWLKNSLPGISKEKR
ncbi:MAG: NADH:ubiquinone reductase (Na(+)-transporting) subunit D [Desulfobacula sp.]|uniref:NADH:ubiquinone reductase (Na(+)-transporting) subunit D n=1 Tax=Desulfobacula sp. TaxID=2593537 RepID=UPI001D5601D2|nr:NADH:ubiquinone reductase (Na(+)-transporting) subunit D [Desulfobacula sp.]MBT3486772.1 NADH:ubiquinone reductase (Na(+)-transporting) subunit D [Desulfobacula sp.]MBT3806392.1 NADH:ubiquinone reductase (Na(+)-transporting) subunit D [Desulfobacula sp.]MBT4023970.1 NADH:ubiquinone reductase (Na(+)-transporting) subunit D [Desulfobacula sp.]MBT4198332.1 NADH:ubiquinone reductase (Na(+)-transporting) subunit D [Desulfobacula sp.]